MQWWGKLSIKEQGEALRKLGNMAVEHEVRHGKLFVRHVETLPDGFRLLNPTSRQAYFGGSKRLGTYLNDIQPRNMGRNGLIFDPAIDSVQKGIFFIGVPTAIGTGLYMTYPE
jgi:hypothetical protein